MAKEYLDSLIAKLLEGFTPKQAKVVCGRYGLKNGKIATLQKIGDELGITRERVRQIEEQALKKLAPKAKEDARQVLEFADTHLASVGGVRRDDYFISEVKNTLLKNAYAKYSDQKLRFVFLAAGAPLCEKENDDFHGFWYANDQAKKKFQEFVKQILQIFRTNDKSSLLNDKIYLAHCRDASSTHFLSIAKHFGVNVFGDFGLRDWPEIEPKTVRDKAYLVLKREGNPLHFGDIAKSINRYGIDRKPAHIQTVHNELIKDDRFVLVGRGMYGLKEHGFEPGTVREVITRLLLKNGPMNSGEVVKLVNSQRFLKENTILLGLQNKRYFKRLEDGRYRVREA